MAYTQILYEVSDSILTITLYRPENLNACTMDMFMELMDAFDRADKDDSIRVIIMTGYGRAFCAGADLSQGKDTFNMDKQKTEALKSHREPAGALSLKIYDLKKPVIVAINGPAMGVGISMTVAADIRLASEKARMGFLFVRRGVISEGCSNWFLPRIVGISKAADWILSGRVFDAKEALLAGFVSEVLPPEALLPRAKEIALEIARNTAPVSVALNRQILFKMLSADHPMEANRLESKCFHWIGQQPDAREGVLSFLEKRPPNFTLKPSQDMPDFYPWWPERKFE